MSVFYMLIIYQL